MTWIVYNNSNLIVKSVSESEPSVSSGESKVEVFYNFPKGQSLSNYKYESNSVVIRSDNEISENRIKNEVESNPSESYRIWKYILPDKENIYQNSTVTPKSLDYVVGVSPKLQKENPIIDERGALTDVVYREYDKSTHTWGDEILKVHNRWEWADDAIYKSGESFLYKKCYRQWILEDGTYKIPWTIQEIIDDEVNGNVNTGGITLEMIENNETDIKFTYKRYHEVDDPSKADYELSMPVGVRARQNIMNKAEVRFVTLVFLLITGNEELAQRVGLRFINKYEAEYSEYEKKGDASFIDLVGAEQDTTEITDALGNVLMTGLSFKSLLDTVIPSTYDLGQGPIPIQFIVPGADQVSDIRGFIQEKYKGEI